jgi:hypothetical protein
VLQLFGAHGSCSPACSSREEGRGGPGLGMARRQCWKRGRTIDGLLRLDSDGEGFKARGRRRPKARIRWRRLQHGGEAAVVRVGPGSDGLKPGPAIFLFSRISFRSLK